MSIVTANNTETNESIRQNNSCVCSCLRSFFHQLKSRKPMGQLQAEIDTQNALRRALNWVQLTGFGLAATIGE